MSDSVAQMQKLMDTILEVRFTDLECEKKCCDELLERANEQGFTYAKAFAYTYLGDCYLAQNEVILSGQYLTKARQLCSNQTYQELYLKACHLFGLYYHMIYDEQHALQYYMEEISIARELGDTYSMCNAWNNIADIYQFHGHPAEAKKYFLLSYNAMIGGDCVDNRLLLILQYNLAGIYGLEGKLDEMEKYIELCELIVRGMEEETTFDTLCCMSIRCRQAGYLNQTERAVQIASDILERKLHESEDKYAIVEFLMPIAQMLVKMEQKECAKRYIELLLPICNIDEIYSMKQMLDLRVSYDEAFSSEDELNKSYKSYCHSMRKILAAEDAVRVNGMNARMNLQEVMRRHESAMQENRRLKDVAYVDELTGLFNRGFFNRQIEGTRKEDQGRRLGIIMLDVDYFKQYNDNYGHIEGDVVLKKVGETLRTCAREGILPCRFGGDEFACVCINMEDEEIEEYIREVRQCVERLNIEHNYSLGYKHITLSIGYSNADKQGYNKPKLVLSQADQTLYKSKAEGRNCWHRYGDDGSLDSAEL